MVWRMACSAANVTVDNRQAGKHDGRLWFPTLRGVVALNPQPYNPQLSRVVIEGATLAGATAPLDQPLRIEPGQENLEIQYTALNWSRPQQIRFKYQMAG